MIISLLLVASLACGGGRQTIAPTAPLPTVPPPASRSGGMILGIEYAPTPLARAFADSGATSAKPYPSEGDWGKVQAGPDAPYDWDHLDAYVRAYQDAGFRHLTLIITARTLWAATEPPQLGDPGDFFPRPEFEDDYAAYVQSFVERYDMDGLQDMPGLRFPVTLFGFEPEYSSYWPGDAASYIRLLELAYPAVKAANPEAQVMAAGLLMTDVFNGYPTPQEVEQRLLNPDPRIWHKSPADVALLLDHPELFDVLDFHSLGDYTEIPPTVRWLREQMAARGYDRPIWIGDSFGGTGLNGWGPATCPRGPNSGWLGYPATEADRCRVAEVLQALADTDAPNHAPALEWIRAETAAGLVRKVVVAAGEGLAGINIGNVEDWEPLMLTLGGAGTSPWQGMVDRNMLTREFYGYRPAFYALQQVAAIIRDYIEDERLSTGEDRDYVYRFILADGRTVIVAWADIGLWLPGDEMPTRPVRIEVGSDESVRVEWTVTSGSQAVVEQLISEAGEVTLELGQIPAFLWP
ncbi:MAG: hypothetical protein AB1449_13045 [Chloroflexota bacterium]